MQLSQYYVFRTTTLILKNHCLREYVPFPRACHKHLFTKKGQAMDAIPLPEQPLCSTSADSEFCENVMIVKFSSPTVFTTFMYR